MVADIHFFMKIPLYVPVTTANLRELDSNKDENSNNIFVNYISQKKLYNVDCSDVVKFLATGRRIKNVY